MNQVLGRAPLELLEFLGPGLLHGLSNHLFAIHGRAQLLRADGDSAHAKSALLSATDKAMHALQVLRFLLGEPGDQAHAQAGVLVHRLCDYLRVPLQDRGLKVRYTHSSTDTPREVPGTAACRAVVETLRQLVGCLPPAFAGVIELDVASQRAECVTIAVHLHPAPGQLPFPLDLESARQRSRALLEAHGVQAELGDRRAAILLRLPVVG